MPGMPDQTRALPRFVDDYLLALLARASHVISVEFHSRLRAKGVAVGEWRVLATLSDGIGGPEGSTVGQLADICLMQQPTMTKLLDRMARDGLVERRGHSEDRRQVLVVSTAKGRALVAELLAMARQHEAELLARHPAREVQAIKDLLLSLIERHKGR
ncbi:MarR family transcriptional regulator [Acetobacteraceae bacterium H6797]|nr:MarR family transcriptional regulator [Acetobacteraceae bacterium H6797]